MKQICLMVLICVLALFIGPHDIAAQSDSLAAPPIDGLMAIEKQANEAWSKGDSRFFDGLLSEKFVAREAERRLDKAAVLKMIADAKCDIKTSNLDEPWLAKVNADMYVLSYRGTYEGTCPGPDGKSIKIASPSRVATVWIRSGDKWQAAFHGENPIVDPKRVSLSTKAVRSATVKRSDARTRTLSALEKAVWDAWKDHDFRKMDSLTAKGLSFIDIFGNSYDNRDTILKTWSSNVCKVKSVNISDAVSFSISPTVALLTHIGTANGTCYGEKLGPIYGNSIYVKEGGAWKLAFTMNLPCNNPLFWFTQ